MTVKLISRDTRGELLIEGRLDSVTAPEAEQIFRDVAARFETVVLNMEAMTYISSAGLRVLRQLHMIMKKKGGELILRGMNRMVTEVFEMTGLICLFTIESD
ncbi:MAG: STAS domain-containing protein [Clostridia bacterium]|nr:STAS domain-containing protein [Clostridia bacterium]